MKIKQTSKEWAEARGAVMSVSVIVRELIKVSDLKKGYTVEVDGRLETVIIRYVKHCSFMGWTYKGDPFREGITRVVFKVPIRGGFRYE